MTFKEITINDFEKYTKFFKSNKLYDDYFGGDLNFKVIFLWQNYQRLQNYINDDFIIMKGQTKHHTFFLAPLAGTLENFFKGIESIKNYCAQAKIPVIIKYLNNTLKNEIINRYAFKEIMTDRNAFEYIYSAQELIKYEGKKFHDKKNHLHQFERYGFTIKPYEKSDYSLVLEVLDYWNKFHTGSAFEQGAIELSLKYYDELDIKCELYMLDNKPCAFVIGTICENNVGTLLFEKANINYKGIYAGINNYFVKNNFKDCQYVNMQDDAGDGGLRKSKLSYNPVFLEEKYNLILK